MIRPSGQEEAKQFYRFCEEDVIAHAAGLVTEGLGDMTLVCACGAVEEDMLSLFHKGAGAKIPDELVVEFGIEGEVEALDSFFLFEGGSAQAKREFLAFSSFDLVLNEDGENSVERIRSTKSKSNYNFFRMHPPRTKVCGDVRTGVNGQDCKTSPYPA